MIHLDIDLNHKNIYFMLLRNIWLLNCMIKYNKMTTVNIKSKKQ
jgi:hypothetical protein